MPIYEYECKKCGTVFEFMQSISADPLKTCMGIGCNEKDNGKVQRLVSRTGFVLKGDGWYTSDYPSEARKKGWEEESKQGKPSAPEAPAPSTAPASASSSNTPAEKSAPVASPNPVQKANQKNPYSGGKKKPQKTSKPSNK